MIDHCMLNFFSRCCLSGGAKVGNETGFLRSRDCFERERSAYGISCRQCFQFIGNRTYLVSSSWYDQYRPRSEKENYYHDVEATF